MDTPSRDSMDIIRIATTYGCTLDSVHEPDFFQYYNGGQPDDAPDLLKAHTGAIGKVARRSFEVEGMQVNVELSVLNESFGLMKVKEECAGQELGWLKIDAETTDEDHKIDIAADIGVCTCGQMHLDGGWLDDDFKQGKELFDQLGLSEHLLANDTLGAVGTIDRDEVYLDASQSSKLVTFLAKTFFNP